MANEFYQFDKASTSNEFDQFDAPVKSSRIPANHGASTLDTGVMGSVGKMLKRALPESVLEGISGASGSLRNVFGKEAFPEYGNTDSLATAVGSFADPVTLALSATGAGAVANLPKLERAHRLYRAVAAGAGAGGAAATPAAFRDAVEGDPLGAAGDIASGAGVGAAAGPVLSGIGSAGSSAVRAIQNITSNGEGQAVQHLNRLFGSRLPDAVEATGRSAGNVPGERLTVGHAAARHNLPEFKTMEEGARARSQGHLFSERDEANNAARLQPLLEMAEPGAKGVATQGGRVPMSAAEANRANVTTPLYERADTDRVQLNPQLAEILNGPEVQDAIGRGGRTFGQQQTNAAVAGRAVPVGEQGAAERGGSYRMLRNPETGAEVGNVHRTNFMPDYGSRSVGELQLAKNEISKQLDTIANASDGASATRRAALEEARRQLTEQMTQQSGNYAVANTIFKNFSAPQNQADIAQVLAQALRSPNGADRPAAYLRALDNAPQVIKKAGGSPRFEQLEQIMTPDQMASIRGIRASALQDEAYRGVKGVGEQVVRPRGVIDSIESNIPSLLSKPITVTRSVLRRQGARSDSEVQQIIDRAMLDPSEMNRLLTGVLPENRNATINALRRFGRDPANVGAAVGAVSPDGDK